MAQVYLSLGSNLGDRADTLRRALIDLSRIGQIERVSSLYETEPVGYDDQPRFLNAVVQLKTGLRPDELLEQTMAIEQSLGRQRSFANAPRTLDIDIVVYDDQIIQSDTLTIPHPRLPERAFVLVPLVEIAPNLRPAGLGKTARELLQRLTVEQRDGVRLLHSSEWSSTTVR